MVPQRPESKLAAVHTSMLTMLDVLSQITRSPYQLVSAETGMVIASSLQPSEMATDEDPPGWAKREEIWTIDELLGLYEARSRQITIFRKGIGHVAQRLSVPHEHINYIVRIHEWGHAIFHLGVTPERSAELAKASLRNDDALQRIAAKDLTDAYKSADSYVHEQIAQLITRLALETLCEKATEDEARKACILLRDTFEKLTRRQPSAYQLDHLQHLECIQLRTRLRAVIDLIRNGGVSAYQKTWDTIMPW